MVIGADDTIERRRWLPERALVLVVDGGFAVVSLALSCISINTSSPKRMCILVAAAGFASTGCGNAESGGQLVGPDDGNTVLANPLTKATYLPASAYRANVVVQITNPDGTPAGGLVRWCSPDRARWKLKLWFRPAGSGKPALPNTTFARASDPASGRTVGQWDSIPVNSHSENFLSLPIGERAKIHPRGPRITVRTRSLYLGADINRIPAPSDPEVPIPVLVAQAWSVVQQTNFSERARAIADEIAEAGPHLVGLQEVSLFRIQ